MKLREANKIAADLIRRLANDEINRGVKDSEELSALFWLRDGIRGDPLDPDELEEYDDCYGIELW